MGFTGAADEPPVALFRQVVQRDIDYEDLSRVDQLVRDILSDEVDLTDARATIARISSSGHHRRRWLVTAGYGVMCAGVALMLGGNGAVMAVAAVAAICIDRLQLRMGRRRLPNFYQQVAGAAVATLLAVAAASFDIGIDPSQAITANIIMLLSGIGFMGALQDCLSGYYVTGSARMTEALLATAGIIAGVSGGLAVADVAGVSIGRIDPGGADLITVSVMALGAAICAAAFAFSAYAPKRVLAPIALIAGGAMAISQVIETSGLGRTWSVAMAAFFIGLVSYAVSGWVSVPPLVVVVSAIVPMLPGAVDLPRPVAARRGRRADRGRHPRHRHRRLGRDRAGLRGDPRRVRRPAAAPRGPPHGAAGSPDRAWSGRCGPAPPGAEESVSG